MSTNVTTKANLTLNSGITLTTNGHLYTNIDTTFINGTINLSNDSGLTKTGYGLFSDTTVIILGSSSTINYNGNNQKISPYTYYNITLTTNNSTKTIEDTVCIFGSLKINNMVTLMTNNKLVIKSDSQFTGNIRTIPTHANLIGKVTIERYIPSIGRRWRFLSSPISNTTIEDWRGEMFVTGAGVGKTPGTINSNGFDATSTNSPSVYYYHEQTQSVISSVGWTADTSIADSLVVGRGYRVFIRGDRDINRISGANQTIYNSQNAVTLKLYGNINVGDIHLPVTYTRTPTSSVNDGWNLVGNPYPSTYDWQNFWNNCPSSNVKNISSTIYVWSPNCNCYKSYNAGSSSGTLTGGFIPEGVAFFVKAYSTSPSLTLSETYKTTNTGILLLKTNDKDEFDLHLSKIGDSITYDDLVVKYLSNSSSTSDDYDIVKMNGDINISAYDPTDSIQLALTSRPTSSNDTINLRLYAPKGNYSFNLGNINTNKSFIYLVDKKLNKNIDFINPHQVAYNFTIDSVDNNKLINDRFMLVVVDKPNSVGVEFIEDDITPLIYPIPSNDIINIKNKTNISSVEVYKSFYKVLSFYNINKNSFKFDVKNLNDDTYIIKMTDVTGDIIVKKIIITK